MNCISMTTMVWTNTLQWLNSPYQVEFCLFEKLCSQLSENKQTNTEKFSTHISTIISNPLGNFISERKTN